MLTRLPIRAGLVAGGLLLLTACVSTTERVTQKDSGPKQPLDVSHIPDAVPRWEPRTRAGNKSPYKVLGKTYELLPLSLIHI